MNIKRKKSLQSLKTIEKITGGKLTLGRLIWAIRQSEESSQVEFAERLDISKQQLCDIEHDRKSVSPKMAADYAKALGYSEEQFVRLCLQEMVNKAGLHMIVDAKKKPRHVTHHTRLHYAHGQST